MSIKSEDINLDKFLETFTPTFISEMGKIPIDDALFMQTAALLRIDLTLKLGNRK